MTKQEYDFQVLKTLEYFDKAGIVLTEEEKKSRISAHQGKRTLSLDR